MWAFSGKKDVFPECRWPLNRIVQQERFHLSRILRLGCKWGCHKSSRLLLLQSWISQKNLNLFAVFLKNIQVRASYVVRVIVHFFSLPLIFTLHWWTLAFLILSSLLQNFHIGFQQKMFPFFYLSL